MGYSLISFYLLVGIPLFSLVSFVSYGLDKWYAKRGESRISEATLHLLDACGGWPGGWVGQKIFRHKTAKTSFQIGFWLSIAINLVGVFLIYRALYG